MGKAMVYRSGTGSWRIQSHSLTTPCLAINFILGISSPLPLPSTALSLYPVHSQFLSHCGMHLDSRLHGGRALVYQAILQSQLYALINFHVFFSVSPPIHLSFCPPFLLCFHLCVFFFSNKFITEFYLPSHPVINRRSTVSEAHRLFSLWNIFMSARRHKFKAQTVCITLFFK